MPEGWWDRIDNDLLKLQPAFTNLQNEELVLYGALYHISESSTRQLYISLFILPAVSMI